jgi:hypothetical protein
VQKPFLSVTESDLQYLLSEPSSSITKSVLKEDQEEVSRRYRLLRIPEVAGAATPTKLI